MTQPKVSFTTSFSHPWWMHHTFRFTPPSGQYDPLQYGQAVLGHAIIQDLVAFLRHHINEPSPYYLQERIDEQDRWFPLQPTLRTLEIETPLNGLFPLPQPRRTGAALSNPWLITLDEQWLYECKSPSVLVPLGLILTRLLPLSYRPIAQLVALWLLYRVLPVCAQSGGPDTWKGLDTMLSPVN